MRMLQASALALGALLIASSARATSLTLNNCDAQGCQGTTLFLGVTDNGNGTFDVTLTVNADGYTGTRLGLNQVGFGAIKNWTSVSLLSDPVSSSTAFSDPVAANTSSKALCSTGASSDKVCTSGFVDITSGGDYTWEFRVSGGAMMAVSDWHIGGQFANSALAVKGQIISASGAGMVPEPSAALLFGLGALLVARRCR
jgi:hypothetical protein